jgi:septum formation protein
VLAPGVVETPRAAETPAARASRLAVEKAMAVARVRPDAVVIGSDQVAALDGTVLHKPGDARRAVAQLLAASGKQVEFLTAVAVAHAGGRRCSVELDRTRVRFRRLDEASLRDYVRRDQPLDCAGAFKAEGLGIALFDSIQSEDPTALVGLPLIRLCSLLEHAGVRVLGDG